MVRRFRKTTTFFILGIVALLALGVGYAQWTDSLNVGGSVQTADMNVRWSDHAVTDNGPSGVDCNITLSNEGKTANLTMTGGYPGASCGFKANIFNNGDVPVEVTTDTYAVAGQTGEWDTDQLFLDDTCIGEEIGVSSNSKHRCDLTVTVEDGAQENSTYGFSATFDAAVDSN